MGGSKKEYAIFPKIKKKNLFEENFYFQQLKSSKVYIYFKFKAMDEEH